MSQNRLLQILSGFEVNKFLSEYYERDLLVIRRNIENKMRFGLDDFEDLLTLPGVRPLLRIVKEQNEDSNPAAVAESGHINKQYLLGMVNKGYTLVLNEIHRLNAELQEFAAELGWELGCYCAVNAYLTPTSSQALKPHFDSHDIFAIQCHGTKIWHVQSEPTELPTLSTHQPILENVTDIAMKEVEMKTGDVMYLPRGTVHYATTETRSSLHLTVGLYPIEWRELLGAITEERANTLQSLRKSVPIGKRRKSDMSDIRIMLKTICDNASDEELNKAMDCVEKTLLRKQPQPMRDSLTSTIRNLEMCNQTSLELRVKRCREAVAVGPVKGGTRIELAGYGFTVPFASEAMIRDLIRDDQVYRVSDRIGSDNPLAEIVVETMIKKGVLRIDDGQQES